MENKIKNFGKTKSTSLNSLRNEIIELFGDKYNVPALDDRIKKFLNRELAIKTPTKRKRSPSAAKSKSVSKRKKKTKSVSKSRKKSSKSSSKKKKKRSKKSKK
ncbi:hypothetical protein CDAR_601881 [Caerostris darwini]|uniref:DEK C-terminal domain-containing protein n=1 Tax=Caerostris darwini TaxID=1538125 RepID=A0AAV4UPR3_9ARAC|nr:hypothetical protein CDAR_601881 [Caerostris darwini]